MPFLRPLPLPGPHSPVPDDSALGTRQEAMFPYLTSYSVSVKASKMEKGVGVLTSVCGCGGAEEAPPAGFGSSGSSLLVFPLQLCGSTKPLSICSISLRGRIMSIFLSSSIILTYNTFLIAFRSIYSTECN